MSLRDDVIALCRAPHAYTMVDGDTRTPAEVRADAILALVLAHATGPEGVERGVRAWVRSRGKSPIKDAILAALGEGE